MTRRGNVQNPEHPGRHTGLVTTMHDVDVSAQIYDAVTSSSHVLAVSHANPDADAVASLIAFRLAFSAYVGEITLALGSGTVPETLVYLPNRDAIQRIGDVQVEDHDLLVLLDCADEGRVGPAGENLLRAARARMPVINIDHHVTNTQYGTINLVDPEAAATCEILTNLFSDLEIPITKDLATTLLSGIQGDTLGLRTPSTTDRTLETSAALLRAGADLDLIVDYLFRIRPFSTLKLWGFALSAATFTGKLIWTEITPAMLTESGADESEAEGIVNFLAGTEGARAAAVGHLQVAEELYGADLDAPLDAMARREAQRLFGTVLPLEELLEASPDAAEGR
jgi:bifunctional oligoribonuclease and PAP phosphatase NrnA